LFSTNWGICFSFKANPNGLNLARKCTVRARQRTCSEPILLAVRDAFLVALKFLPQGVADDSQAMAGFQRLGRNEAARKNDFT